MFFEEHDDKNITDEFIEKVYEKNFAPRDIAIFIEFIAPISSPATFLMVARSGLLFFLLSSFEAYQIPKSKSSYRCKI